MCGSSRAGPSPKCGARRLRCRVPSSGARPRWPVRNGGRRSVTACSSTTTRTRKIGRRAPPIRCARCPTPGCRRRSTGTRSRTASRPTSRYSPCRSVSPKLGDPHAGIDDAPGSLEKLLELAAKDEAAGLGDAPWPPHFRKMEGEAPRVAPSRAKSTPSRHQDAADEDAAGSGGELSRQRRRAGRPGKMEDANMPRWPDCSPWTTCWWIPCEAGHPPGPASASTSAMCRKTCGLRRRLPIRTTIRRANGAAMRAREDDA